MATSLSELQISLAQVATGLDDPLHITHAGDDRLFVSEQGGRVRIIQNGQVLATPFLDISGSSNFTSGGGGARLVKHCLCARLC
ncbi:MAG: PQQ-dependent sugar dehydrogenase [Microcoleus sp. SIO2G3]|nr:PQQ-dependent sugar dehydrogenase [Microcoleus sp. SIO2G3]